jgi:DNA-binding transcriptional ArsR family regulator
MPDEGTTRETSALRAVAHPVRLRILSLLTGSEMSAADVARELGITHANASYHLRVLATSGLVVEAGEERIRGGVAKRYRHPWKSERAGAAATAQDRRLYMQALAEELVRRFDFRRPRTRSFLSDAEMWVEPAVWQQVLALHEQASDLMHANARPPRTKGTIHVNATTVAFQMTERRPAAPVESGDA